MSIAKTVVKITELPKIYEAAMLLEKHNLLLNDEKANEVIKRYMAMNPDINEAMARAA